MPRRRCTPARSRPSSLPLRVATTAMLGGYGPTAARVRSPAMSVYALGDLVPHIDPDAFVHPDATIIGNVVIGPGSTIWPQTVLRGDQSRIVIGARTSVQDGAILH